MLKSTARALAIAATLSVVACGAEIGGPDSACQRSSEEGTANGAGNGATGIDPTSPGPNPGTGSPGTDPGTDPGTGTDPGGDPGTGTDPGGDPGTDPGTFPGDPVAPVGVMSRKIGYFSAWSIYGRDYHVADLPGDMLTHINYAFFNIQSGECVLGDAYADIDKFYPGDTWDQGALRGNFNQLLKLKAQHSQLRTLMSVGGWTWSGDFSDVALTAASRAAFARSCIDLMVQYGFDGVDIDWEYPVSGGIAWNTYRDADTENYTLLMAEFRRQMNAREVELGRSEKFLLTIAIGAGPSKLENLDLPGLAASLDWINIMSYDYYGAWANETGHNAALFPQSDDPGDPGLTVDAPVQHLLAAGVPKSKITVGVPFYGRSWTGVPGTNDGLYQSGTGPGPGTWEDGVLEYKDIAANYLGQPGWERHWDDEAQVPFLYNASTQQFITYDDAESLRIKRNYVADQGLSGIMIWEMNSDDAQHTLMRAVD